MVAAKKKLNLVVLDLDTFTGSECFMQATKSGASFTQGLRAYLNADYVRAAEEFRLALIAAYVEGDDRKAVVTSRDRAIIYLYTGNALAFQSDWEGALREYLNAVQTDASLTEAHYNIGVALAAVGQLEKASNAFKEALKHNGDLYDAKFALGRCCQAMDFAGMAYIYYSAARDSRPDAAEPLYHIGLMHQAHGAHDLAQTCFAEALRVEPSFRMEGENSSGLETHSEQEASDWYYRLGEDLKSQGYPEEAERIYRALLQWKPQENRARYLLGNLLARQKRWKDALAEYQQIPAMAPQFTTGCIRISNIFRLMGKHQIAYQVLFRCAKRRPQNAEVFEEMAKALLNLGRPKAALKCLEHAARLNDRNAQTFYLLGRVYMALGKENTALAAWRKALRLAPQMVSLHYDLGVICLKRRRYQEAIRELQAVLEQWPDDLETQYLLGLALKESGDPGQAASCLEQVVRHNPQHIQALYALGACHLLLGNSQTGMAYLQQYDRLLQQAVTTGPRKQLRLDSARRTQ